MAHIITHQSNVEAALDPLLGVRINVDDAMVNSKLAVKIGNTIYVSPAMFSLMKTASPDELQHLLSNIRCLQLDDDLLIQTYIAPTAFA